MSKILYFNNKFSKIAKRYGYSASPAPRKPPILVTWSYAICQKMFFKRIMAKSMFTKVSYDVVSATSSLLRQQKCH